MIEAALSEHRRRRLVRFCAAVSGDRSAAEDLAQETLLEAWRNQHKLTDPSGVDRWLAAVARNVCRRWARRKGADLAEVATIPETIDMQRPLDDEVTRGELVDLLDRNLAVLAPAAREVLVARYIEDLPHAEIARRLGIGEDAVSMRLARAKKELRRLLAAELDDEPRDEWRETRLWCTHCGRARLSMRRSADRGNLAFRCGGCSSDPSVTVAEFPLDNPSFAELVGDLRRPSPIRRRLTEWSLRYYHALLETRVARCTRCGADARADVVDRKEGNGRGERRGVFVDCNGCGEQVWLSAAGIATALPDVKAFLRDNPRAFALPSRELDVDGRGALVVGFQHLFGAAKAEVVFERASLRVLETLAA